MTGKNPESHHSKDDARRRILKRLVAGGGIVATGKMIPDDWQKPVVESVILPAHAQTTQEMQDQDEPPPPNTEPNDTQTNGTVVETRFDPNKKSSIS